MTIALENTRKRGPPICDACVSSKMEMFSRVLHQTHEDKSLKSLIVLNTTECLMIRGERCINAFTIQNYQVFIQFPLSAVFIGEPGQN